MDTKTTVQSFDKFSIGVFHCSICELKVLGEMM